MSISKLNQKLSLVILLLVLGVAAFIGSSFLMKLKVIEITPSPAQVSENLLKQTQPTENETIALIFVGDIQ